MEAVVYEGTKLKVTIAGATSRDTYVHQVDEEMSARGMSDVQQFIDAVVQEDLNLRSGSTLQAVQQTIVWTKPKDRKK
jgi:hypothetical protein